MDHIKTPIFQALFQSEVPRIILKANAPHFTIMDYNDAHQLVTGKTITDHRGEDLWEVYQTQIAGKTDPEVVTRGLEQAIRENKVIKLDPFRFDVVSEATGEVMLRWWQLEILPVEKEPGSVHYLMITTNNVTSAILAEHREQELSQELAATNEELAAANKELQASLKGLEKANLELAALNQTLEARIESRVKELSERESSLRSLVMTAHYPLMILRGRDWIIEIANQQLVNLWEKTIEGVTGHRLMDILPELKDQAFPGFLRQVYDTGIGYGEEERIFHYNSPTGPATKYVSFYYDPMHDQHGEVCGIIVAADDITAKVEQRKQLEESLQNEQAISEEYTALNEELASTVEELSVANEELSSSQEELSRKNMALTASEARFKSLIRQAPVGICVIRTSDLMVMDVNDGYLELVGKSREELESKTIWEAVAEAAEAYAPIMAQVIENGKPFLANEHELILIRYGKPETVFVDFVYEPVFDQHEKVSAIMVVVIEVTEKVRARLAIADAEERSRLAIEAAEIGTFEFNYLSGALISSDRFDEIFGLSGSSSRDQVLAKYHPDDVQLSALAHETAKREGKMMYEARLLGKDDSIRWIRVQAKTFFQSDGVPEKLLGTVLDITEFKRLQQQKDDFLSIASHELKTPLTALKGSMQLLSRMKDHPNSDLLPRLIAQSAKSMNKISSLVDDLLNVSRMNQTGISLKKTTFNLKKLLDDCCGHVREEGNYELIFQGDEDLEAYGDQDRIEQVIVNLVNNAVKYAPDSREIYLIVAREDDRAKVMVKDKGPGISLEKQLHIFDRYYRAEEGKYQVSGLGLGLYISADIIARHKGKIGVDSVPGEGATFWFTLPLEPVLSRD